jgi:uncharacterized protein with NAD-binding domain and iron-sulfur cluster
MSSDIRAQHNRVRDDVTGGERRRLVVAGKQKVAILGGGVGSIVAAYELTNTPELRERYEVTIHQLGWRLGGKGASGRNAAFGQRIEEHGLHIWFGFYENAFRVMREAYAQLQRPAGAPLADWRDAFKPCDDIILYENYEGRWQGRSFKVPRNPLIPGQEPVLPNFWELAHSMLDYMLARWGALKATNSSVAAALAPRSCLPFGVDRIAQEVIGGLLRLGLGNPERAIAEALDLTGRRSAGGVGEPDEESDRSLLWWALDDFKRWLWRRVVAPHADDDDLRFFFTMFDAGSTMLQGVIEDGLVERGFDRVNGEDLRAWLRRHGAQPITLEQGPFVRAVYDMAFAYEDGDVKCPAMAAGTAVQDALRLFFTYRGAFAWKMQAGMGDTVFVPFYEVLRRRGVRFEFFHWVSRLGLSRDRRCVEEIEVIPQVRLRRSNYEPLVTVEDLECWPSEPQWDQVVQGKKLCERGVNLEWEANPLGNEALTLHRGEDFDIVVLGISVGALEPICRELIEDASNPRFRAMIEHSRTIMTQAFQLWLHRPLARLGWQFAENSIMTAFVEPLDTYANMAHLLPREAWPRGMHVEDIAYFCGVLEERSGETQQDANERVREQAIAYLGSQVQTIWPHSTSRGGFDWRLLADSSPAEGPTRFAAQFWGANFQPSERYVLTPPGSVQYRLKADESGYENLFLAGDWIKSGLDGGCVEAAVMSGMQASRAICGAPAVIVGEDGTWLAGPGQEAPSPAGPGQGPGSARTPTRPPYVEYGGLATCPSPVNCTDATLYSFFLEADHEHLLKLCRRVFSQPSGGQIDVRPLTSHVMLTFGTIERIEPQLAPWSQMGYASERQVAIWVPVVVKHHGAVPRIGWFVPYMWVDNPLSLAGGREVYGYPKNWGWIGLPEDGQPGQLTLDAYGGNYDPSRGAGPYRLMELTTAKGRGTATGKVTASKSRPLATGGMLWSELSDVVDHAHRALTQHVTPTTTGLGLDDRPHEPLRRLFEDILHRRGIPEFYLRQFRSVADGRRASPRQQITDAVATVRRIKGRPLLSQFKFTVQQRDSHPVRDELGLDNQSTRLAFEVQMDFVLEEGSVLWEA